MVKATKDGYKIHDGDGNVYYLNENTALGVANAVDRQFHKQDVINYIKADDELELEKITDEEIENIIDEFEDALYEDDSWVYILHRIIENYSFGYKNKEE